jgi:hypothetical protein
MACKCSGETTSVEEIRADSHRAKTSHITQGQIVLSNMDKQHVIYEVNGKTGFYTTDANTYTPIHANVQQKGPVQCVPSTSDREERKEA